MSIWEIIIGIIVFIILIIIGCVIHGCVCDDTIPDYLELPLPYQTNMSYMNRDYRIYDSYRDISGQLHLQELRLEDLKRRLMYERDFRIINPEPLPQNCKNCGAPLHSHECEYCGTRY